MVVIEPEDLARDLATLVHGDRLRPWLEQSVADWRMRGLLKQ